MKIASLEQLFHNFNFDDDVKNELRNRYNGRKEYLSEIASLCQYAASQGEKLNEKRITSDIFSIKSQKSSLYISYKKENPLHIVHISY